MADNTAANFYVDVPQTGIAVRRFQTDSNFLAAQMCPMVIVTAPTGKYPVWNMADFNRDEMQVRGANAPSKRGAFSLSFQDFDTDARSLRYDLNTAMKAAAQVQTNPEAMVPMALAYKALIHAERRLKTAFFSSSKWYRTITGAGSDSASEGTTAMNRLYLDDTSTDPVEVIGEEIRIQGKLTGRRPTGMAFGSRLWHKLRNHSKVRSQLLAGTTPIVQQRQASLAEMATLLELAWCGVSNAIYNTALEGEDPSNDFIIPEDDAVLFYSPNPGQVNGPANLDIMNDGPSGLARFVWNGVASGEGIQVRRFRDEDAGPGGSDVSVIDVYNGYGVITQECGTYWTGMVTP